MTLYKPMHFHAKNKKIKKINWTDDEKRFLLDHSKEMPLSALAEKLGREESQIVRMCTRIGCGYFTNQQSQPN